MHALDSWVCGQTITPLKMHHSAWQEGFHDTRIRSTKQFHFMLSYIENNPVEEELVESPGMWQWSSAHESYGGLLIRPWPWGFENDKHNDMVGIY